MNAPRSFRPLEGKPPSNPGPINKSLPFLIQTAVILHRQPLILPNWDWEIAFEEKSRIHNLRHRINWPQDLFSVGDDENRSYHLASSAIRAREKSQPIQLPEGLSKQQQKLAINYERQKRIIEFLHPKEYSTKAPETDSDKSNDTSSVHRKLDHDLFMITKPKDSDSWFFPLRSLQDNEFLRTGAQLSMEDQFNCIHNKHLFFLSNSPDGFCSWKHTPEAEKESGKPGSRVFFYRSLYLYDSYAHQVTPNDPKIEVQWLTKAELEDYLEPSIYRTMLEILPNEPFPFK